MSNETNWLVRMRKGLGLTQEDVAKALDVTTRTIINWENGHHEPRLTLRQTKALCRLLQISQIEDMPDVFWTESSAETVSHNPSANGGDLN